MQTVGWIHLGCIMISIAMLFVRRARLAAMLPLLAILACYGPVLAVPGYAANPSLWFLARDFWWWGLALVPAATGTALLYCFMRDAAQTRREVARRLRAGQQKGQGELFL